MRVRIASWRPLTSSLHSVVSYNDHTDPKHSYSQPGQLDHTHLENCGQPKKSANLSNLKASLDGLRRAPRQKSQFLTTILLLRATDRRETRNLRASIPGLAQLQEIADDTEIERMQEFRKKQLDAMAKAKADAEKNRKKGVPAK